MTNNIVHGGCWSSPKNAIRCLLCGVPFIKPKSYAGVFTFLLVCVLLFVGYTHIFSVQSGVHYQTQTLPVGSSTGKASPNLVTSTTSSSTSPNTTVSLPLPLTSIHDVVDLVAPKATSGVYNITLVSAYIDIGEFGKGTAGNKRDNKIYTTWSEPFSKVVAPLLFFTDSLSFSVHIQDVRRDLAHLTKIVHVNRSELWAFQQRPSIAKVYAGNYPKHWPNTVYPDYTCLTHAKFDFILDALDKAYFPPTPYVAWMDVGYLRDIVNRAYPTLYYLRPPNVSNVSRVMVGQVNHPDFHQPWQGIFRENKNWVAGGFFLATRDVFRAFVLAYRRAVMSFLQLGESNVEQHVLYAMYTDSGRTVAKPDVEFHTIHSPNWFDIGYQCLQGVNITSPSLTPVPSH